MLCELHRVFERQAGFFLRERFTGRTHWTPRGRLVCCSWSMLAFAITQQQALFFIRPCSSGKVAGFELPGTMVR